MRMQGDYPIVSAEYAILYQVGRAYEVQFKMLLFYNNFGKVYCSL